MRNLHLFVAHLIWEQHIQQSSIVIDATAGNGHDSLFLGKLLCSYEGSQLLIFDIQKQAIEMTRQRLETIPPSPNLEILYFHQSHYPFPKEIEHGSVNLIVYNLGYLPGGDKKITTTRAQTLPGLQESLNLLKEGGLLSVTCYPGHQEGLEEYEEILKWTKQLSSKEYTIYHLQSNKLLAPQLITVKKELTSSLKSL